MCFSNKIFIKIYVLFECLALSIIKLYIVAHCDKQLHAPGLTKARAKKATKINTKINESKDKPQQKKIRKYVVLKFLFSLNQLSNVNYGTTNPRRWNHVVMTQHSALQKRISGMAVLWLAGVL